MPLTKTEKASALREILNDLQGTTVGEALTIIQTAELTIRGKANEKTFEPAEITVDSNWFRSGKLGED